MTLCPASREGRVGVVGVSTEGTLVAEEWSYSMRPERTVVSTVSRRFEELSALLAQGGPPAPEAMAALRRQYDTVQVATLASGS